MISKLPIVLGALTTAVAIVPRSIDEQIIAPEPALFRLYDQLPSQIGITMPAESLVVMTNSARSKLLEEIRTLREENAELREAYSRDVQFVAPLFQDDDLESVYIEPRDYPTDIEMSIDMSGFSPLPPLNYED